MSTEASDQLELEIKRLERDKRLEEIRQLRASGRRQWITPTALAAVLPLLAGLGVWVFNEMKQYHEGYRALEERDRLAARRRSCSDRRTASTWR
jgi:ferric-dicitrate binding protein FerR (iron transport regulator)